jgi:hypothetical protein
MGKKLRSRAIMSAMRGGTVLKIGFMIWMAWNGALAQEPATTLPAQAPEAKSAMRKPASPKSADEPKHDPKELLLLKQSYAAGTALDASSRAILLEKQCDAAEDIQDVAKSWCTELFQLAKDQLPSGDFRAHVQTAAARAMSVHDSETALAMLQDVDVTDAQSDERASVSRMIFEGVMQDEGSKSFPDLMTAAARLGETGSYPYLATTIMLYGGTVPRNLEEASSRHYTEKQTDTCNQVLQQGLTYFKKDSMNIKADFQFMTLLRAGSKSGCASGWLIHQAVTDFSNELIKVATAAINGDEKVKPHTAKMLYNSAQHLLQDIDPVLAESVEKRVGDVRNISEPTSTPKPPKVNSGGSWMSDPDAKVLYDKIGDAEGVLNNAPDGTTPHTPEMENAIREGFSAAQKLVSKVQDLDPDAAANLRRGGGNMPAFLDAALRIWPEATVDQIEALPDGEFKATLLITAAQNMQRNSERDFVMRRQLH